MKNRKPKPRVADAGYVALQMDELRSHYTMNHTPFQVELGGV